MPSAPKNHMSEEYGILFLACIPGKLSLVKRWSLVEVETAQETPKQLQEAALLFDYGHVVPFTPS